MKTHILFCLLLCSCFIAQAQNSPADGAPMLSELKQQRASNKLPNKEVFSRLYQQANKPKFVIFFNRALSDQMSEWRTDTIDHKVYRDLFGKPYEPDNEYRLKRQEKNHTRSINLNEKQSFDIEQGFVEALLKYRVKMIERDIVMRYVERKFRTSPYELKPYDVQKLELEALNEYADVLIEVLYSNDNGKLNVLVTATNVLDMTILAKFNVDNQEGENTWVATNGGYQQVQDHTSLPTMQLVATERGYEIQQVSEKVLLQKGTESANYLINQLIDNWQ